MIANFRRPSRAPILLVLSTLLLSGCGHSRRPPATGGASTESTGKPLQLEVPPLPARESLPEEAREMLRGRMLRHGEEMIYLLTSVVLLDYADVARTADRIAGSPKLGRPAPGETDTLNALLPSAFFEHQDDLANHARSLGKAARAVNEEQLLESFAALTKSCVGCHAAYLDDGSEPPLHEEPDDLDPASPDHERLDEEPDSRTESDRKSPGRSKI